MRIVCLSDTHTMLSRVKVPDGDILIHAGDHTWRGTENEIIGALTDLAALPHKYKVLIAGNHDFWFDHRFRSGHMFRNWRIQRTMRTPEMMAKFPTLTYLQDSGAEIEGVKFYGSPWQPWYYDWAFQFKHGDTYGQEAKATWAVIPQDTQVLITHTPPLGVLDQAESHFGAAKKNGCPHLRDRLEELPNLRLHVFGHIHESYGRADYKVNTDDGETGNLTFVNAAICTLDYDPTNQPIVVDI